MASTSANERAEHTKHLQNRRGETVVCVFRRASCTLGEVGRFGLVREAALSRLGRLMTHLKLSAVAAVPRSKYPVSCSQLAPRSSVPPLPPRSMQGWGNLVNTLVLVRPQALCCSAHGTPSLPVALAPLTAVPRSRPAAGCRASN